MTRYDLGAIVSRALAVWLIPSIFWGAAEVWRQNQAAPVTGIPMSVLVLLWASPAVQIVVAALLWWKAGSFGQWLDKTAPPASPNVEMNATSVASALILAVAGYWFVICLTDAAYILSDASRLASETAPPRAGHIWVEVTLAAIAVIAAFAARPLAGLLCKR